MKASAVVVVLVLELIATLATAPSVDAGPRFHGRGGAEVRCDGAADDYRADTLRRRSAASNATRPSAVVAPEARKPAA